jgi:hypothetical protein
MRSTYMAVSYLQELYIQGLQGRGRDNILLSVPIKLIRSDQRRLRYQKVLYLCCRCWPETDE